MDDGEIEPTFRWRGPASRRACRVTMNTINTESELHWSATSSWLRHRRTNDRRQTAGRRAAGALRYRSQTTCCDMATSKPLLVRESIFRWETSPKGGWNRWRETACRHPGSFRSRPRKGIVHDLVPIFTIVRTARIGSRTRRAVGAACPFGRQPIRSSAEVILSSENGTRRAFARARDVRLRPSGVFVPENYERELRLSARSSGCTKRAAASAISSTCCHRSACATISVWRFAARRRPARGLRADGSRLAGLSLVRSERSEDRLSGRAPRERAPLAAGFSRAHRADLSGRLGRRSESGVGPVSGPTAVVRWPRRLRRTVSLATASSAAISRAPRENAYFSPPMRNDPAGLSEAETIGACCTRPAWTSSSVATCPIAAGRSRSSARSITGSWTPSAAAVTAFGITRRSQRLDVERLPPRVEFFVDFDVSSDDAGSVRGSDDAVRASKTAATTTTISVTMPPNHTERAVPRSAAVTPLSKAPQFVRRADENHAHRRDPPAKMIGRQAAARCRGG